MRSSLQLNRRWDAVFRRKKNGSKSNISSSPNTNNQTLGTTNTPTQGSPSTKPSIESGPSENISPQKNSGTYWKATLENFKAQVGQDSYSKIMVTRSIDTLGERIQSLTATSKSSRAYDALKEMSPLVLQLKSVSVIASTIAPTSPEVGVMIWGSVAMIAVLSNNNDLVNTIVEYLRPIGRSFPRFGKYITWFPESDSLQKALEMYCGEVIDFLGYAIKLLKGPKYILPSPAAIEIELRNRMKRISLSDEEVEKEAKAARMDPAFNVPGQNSPSVAISYPTTVHCLDILENRKFCGRTNILKSLDSQLLNTNGAPRQGGSVCLHGLGGIGKSGLALKFIYNHIDSFPYIFWFPADTIQKLSMAVTKASKQLKLHPAEASVDTSNYASLFRNWLLENDSWIIVFDNAEDESLLTDIWPRKNTGTIIVTSRHPELASTLVEQEHEICAMTLPESVELLLKLLPQKYKTGNNSTAEKICKLLDGLPLAITLAAGFIRQTLRTLEETFEELQKTRQILLTWPHHTADGKSQNPLLMLWEANISSLSLYASSLLEIMALLDADSIDETIIRDFKISSPNGVLPQDESVYLLSLRDLTNYSLIQRDLSKLSLHRLVQDVIIRRMDLNTQQRVFSNVVDFIWSIFPKQSEEGLLMSSVWDRCQSYMPHVESLVARYHELSPTLNLYPLHLAEVAYFCSWSMYERGLFTRAIKLAFTGIKIATDCNSETRLQLADLWTTIGGAQLESTNLLIESYNSLKKALNIRLEAVRAGLIDSNHPQIANSYMSLGTAALGIGKTQEAIDLGKKSILLREKRKEDQLQMLAMSYHNVALAALTAGQLGEAEEFIQKAIDLSKQTGKSMTLEHKLAMDARTLYCLGNIYLAKKDKANAISYHEQALCVRLQAFREYHPRTACSNWKLGQLYEAEDWTKTVSYYRKSIEIYERLTSVEAELGRVVYQLGTLLSRHGEEEGHEFISQARELYKMVTRKDLPDQVDDPFMTLLHPFCR